MDKKIQTYRMDSCAYYRNHEKMIICMNPKQQLWMPICATRKCKYFTPKQDEKEAEE